MFKGSGGEVEYIGEFAVDAANPFYPTDAPDTGDGPVRQVLVFRLRAIENIIKYSEDQLPSRSGQRVTEVEVKIQHTERFVVRPGTELIEAERREQLLALSFKKFLEERGSRIIRHCCWPEGEAKPLYTDLFDGTRLNLFEVKGSVTREAIRMAIGQLLDYRRFIEPTPRLAVLVPTRPRADLKALLRSNDIACVWPDGVGFVDNDGGSFSVAIK